METKGRKKYNVPSGGVAKDEKSLIHPHQRCTAAKIHTVKPPAVLFELCQDLHPRGIPQE
jgi:hypothetical protein